jgi:hypothetical protein
MATAGVIIALAVVEEEATPAVETAVDVLMQAIADAGHRQ